MKQHIINEHPVRGGGATRTVLSVSTNDVGDVTAWHITRELKLNGGEWEPITTSDGVKLHSAEMLEIASIVCLAHAEFTTRKAARRRAARGRR